MDTMVENECTCNSVYILGVTRQNSFYNQIKILLDEGGSNVVLDTG